ncbi:MAG TPA: hypothetical protein VE569_06350, partial [Acidimicrobiia bacterium]|nr:hypothetical protein [Acidimicrobiia bacterium]
VVVAVAFSVAAGLVAYSSDFPDWTWWAVAGGAFIAVALTWLFDSTVNTRNFLTTTAAAVVVLGAAAGVTFIDGWSKWNYEGYEAKDSWSEYRHLIAELDTLPGGRVQWESNRGLNKYGTPMSPMLIPYWTEGKLQSMEGLYFESSLTTPFHFINHSEMSYKPSNPIPGLPYDTFNMERGLAHMDLYGVEYYVSFTPEAAERANETEGFTELAVTGPFHIFKLPETELVVPATHQPAVYDVPERGLIGALLGSGTVTGSNGQPRPDFFDMALDYYVDVENLDRWIVAGGPDDWPRIETVEDRPDVELNVGEDAVSNIVVDDERISFTTEAVGVPHMIKVSYFPNWTATGAEGPWRAAPSLMVVVPTQNEVVLEFRDTWAETGGKLLTLGGFGALIIVGGMAFWRRRRIA